MTTIRGVLRAVIDTNVPIAGILWRAPPNALLERVRAGTVSRCHPSAHEHFARALAGRSAASGPGDRAAAAAAAGLSRS
jgi:hypothetical protein